MKLITLLYETDDSEHDYLVRLANALEIKTEHQRDLLRKFSDMRIVNTVTLVDQTSQTTIKHGVDEFLMAVPMVPGSTVRRYYYLNPKHQDKREQVIKLLNQYNTTTKSLEEILVKLNWNTKE